MPLMPLALTDAGQKATLCVIACFVLWAAYVGVYLYFIAHPRRRK